MTRDEAKEILQGYRPNGADASDPFFADALQRAVADPELGRWFAEQQKFDAAMTRACANVLPPDGFRERLLARAAKAQPWWNRPLKPRPLALAASIALAATVAAFWLLGPRDQFASFRDEVVEQSWVGSRHVQFESSDLAAIRKFIDANGGRGDFDLPPELTAIRPRGCSVLSVKGHSVPYICFVDHSKHLHVAVMDAGHREDFLKMPEFSKWQNIDAFTWREGDAAYTLTGMKPLRVMKTLRKDGQWTWGG